MGGLPRATRSRLRPIGLCLEGPPHSPRGCLPSHSQGLHQPPRPYVRSLARAPLGRSANPLACFIPGDLFVLVSEHRLGGVGTLCEAEDIT